MAGAKIEKEGTGPNPIDIYVGNRVKTRRLILGLSQEELAKSIGLTFQQVQKYERGTNRISVSRLVDISRVLKVPVEHFFEGSTNIGTIANKKTLQKGLSDNGQKDLSPDIMTKRDVLELVRAYSKIKNPQFKKQVLEMAKTMSSNES